MRSTWSLLSFHKESYILLPEAGMVLLRVYVHFLPLRRGSVWFEAARVVSVQPCGEAGLN